jgi:glutamate formiminotransferase
MLVECVPNFSEGRSKTVVDAIVNAMAAHPIHVLDVSMDADHHRSVVTFIGSAEAVEAAAVAGITMAASLIDLTRHQGVHPRIGAADVVPLIPLRDATMDECVEIAQRIGRQVGEWGLPVYLYEAAARRPERRNLADVRRGGYEGLRERISQAEWQPDFGPARVGTAGAVAIGARAPLVAFNIFLHSDDVAIAQSIAGAIRTSGGGLPYLKAIGVMVRGRAQVSMNITDFRRTSLHAVVTAVRVEAVKRGVQVAESELIGLIPQTALIDYALESLGLESDVKSRILEHAVGTETSDYRPIHFE